MERVAEKGDLFRSVLGAGQDLPPLRLSRAFAASRRGCSRLAGGSLPGRDPVRYRWRILTRGPPRGRSSMAEPQPSKLVMRVRFPSPAPFARSRFPSSERCLMSGVWPGSPQGSGSCHGRSITTQWRFMASFAAAPCRTSRTKSPGSRSGTDGNSGL